MTRVSWSTCEDSPCLRVHGGATATRVAVRPSSSRGVQSRPATAGRLVADGDDVCFVPRFPFLAGTEYEVEVDGTVVGTATCAARSTSPPTTEVVGIHPTAVDGAPQPPALLRGVLGADAGGGCHPRALGRRRRRAARRCLVGDRVRVVGSRPATAHRVARPGAHQTRPRSASGGRVPLAGRHVGDAGRGRGVPRRVGPTHCAQVRRGPGRWSVTSVVTSCRRRGRSTPGAAGTVEPLDVTFDRPLDHGLVAALSPRRGRRRPGRRFDHGRARGALVDVRTRGTVARCAAPPGGRPGARGRRGQLGATGLRPRPLERRGRTS